jgi:hypothetical protein
MERAGNPPPNVLLMVAMAFAAWVLLYMVVVGVWSWHGQRSEIFTESVHRPQVASLADEPAAQLAIRKRAKVSRRRQRGTWLTARVFRSTI